MFQVAVVTWAKLRTADCPDLGLLFAVPNGGRMRIGVAKKLVAEGLRAGVPDLVLPVARPPYHGLFIEMKTSDQSLSPEQRWWRDELAFRGYSWARCRTDADAIQVLCAYLGIGRDGRSLTDGLQAPR